MYEVQYYTQNQKWTNNWKTFDDMEGEKPQVFETVEEAQEELDKFFDNIHTDILNGQKGVGDSYYRDEFMIVEIKGLLQLAA